jgi:hypothetical protein
MQGFLLALLTSSIGQAAYAAIEGELATAMDSPDPLGAMAAIDAKLATALAGHPIELNIATKLVNALVKFGEAIVAKAIPAPAAPAA